jgi:KDO2-lipid IV(A) lauroyltransferase
MLSASPAYLAARYSFTNRELMSEFEDKNQSILISVGHYCNWEWSTVVTPLAIKPQCLIIYKPLQNEVFDNAFKKAREKSGTKMIKMVLALKEIVKHKKELTATVFAADQTPARAEKLLWIDFLNQSTPVFLGLEKIAKSTNYPIVFCDMQRVKRGYYSCDFKLVCADPSKTEELEITKKQFELLENRINAEPRYWLWSHKRWKHKFEEHDRRA